MGLASSIVGMRLPGTERGFCSFRFQPSVGPASVSYLAAHVSLLRHRRGCTTGACLRCAESKRAAAWMHPFPSGLASHYDYYRNSLCLLLP